jgi:fatty-acyl-CoA synthase
MISTLPQALMERAQLHPERAAIIFADANHPDVSMSYRELADAAMASARWLAQCGIDPSARIILIMDDLIDLVTTFWGALFRGAHPAIVAPPSEIISEGYLDGLRRKVERLGVEAIICRREWKRELSDSLNIPIFTPERIAPIEPDQAAVAHDPNATAYIQFSSGTTGEPRGIAITHRMVMEFLETYQCELEFSEASCIVSWLPLHHDMGLVGNLILSMYAGSTLVLIPTQQWLRRPALLFTNIHRHRATHVIMPNFAFGYTTRLVDQKALEGIDLSSVRRFANGSEPVHLSTFQEFWERFKSYGLAESSLAVGYGLAEMVLSVATTPMNAGLTVDWIDSAALQAHQEAIPVSPDSLQAKAVVSCGRPYLHTELRIGNEEEALEERQVGQIYVRAPWRFSGRYLGDASNSNFLRSEWFPTGDVGYLADGELYVLGRHNDLIIIGGQNIQPSEIEAVANEVEGIRQGRCVAFGVYDEQIGTDSAVLICEAQTDLDEETRKQLSFTVRRRVRETLGLALGDVRVVERKWIQKTTSGKLARSANRDRYLAEVSKSQQVSFYDIESLLIRLWEELFGLQPLDRQTDFFTLGGTSLQAVTLVVRIREAVGVSVPISLILEAPTPAALADLLTVKSERTRQALVCFQPKGNKRPLFIFHALGGHLLGYRTLLSQMPSDQPIYGLQAKGADEHSPQTVEDMAGEYLREIRRMQPHSPYLLAGGSFGGYLAFEAAQQLITQGEEIGLLVLFDTTETNARRKNKERRPRLLQKVRASIRFHLHELSQRGLGDRILYLSTLPSRLIQKIITRQTNHHQAVVRNDLQSIHRRAMAHYKPKPYSGKIVYFKALNSQFPDAVAAWQRLAPGGLTVIEVPGRHWEVVRHPQTITTLQTLLSEVQSTESLSHISDIQPPAKTSTSSSVR